MHVNVLNDDIVASTQGSSVQCGRTEYENLLRVSQKEVLWLQRQLSVTSTRQVLQTSDHGSSERCEENPKEADQEKVKSSSSPS